MESCGKELYIGEHKNSIQGFRLKVKCCQGKNHDGEHEWHIWTNDYNEATKAEGLIKVIH